MRRSPQEQDQRQGEEGDEGCPPKHSGHVGVQASGRFLVEQSRDLLKDEQERGAIRLWTPAMAAEVADHVWTLEEIAGLLD